jgi:hypothetical protein
MAPTRNAVVNTKLLRAALVGIDGRFENARRAKAQIEAEEEERSVEGSVYEEPNLALGASLEEVYELLLVAIEAAGLPRTRSRLIKKWTTITRVQKSGSGTYDRQYDYFDSPSFQFIEQTLEALRLLSGDPMDTREAYELTKLESVLRKTATVLNRNHIVPTNEREVRDVMHNVLFACFTEYVSSVHVPGIIKNFIPDSGVRDLRAAIEFKFADSHSEVLKAVGGVFEDGAGYKGSRDWTRFYSVIYQTQSFESEDRVRSEMIRGGLLTWKSILVTGAGARTKVLPAEPPGSAAGS